MRIGDNGDYSFEEMNTLVNLFEQNKDKIYGSITFTEFIEEFICRCEGCGKLVFSDKELPIATNWKNEKIRSCEECYRDSEEYEAYINGGDTCE